MVKVLAESRVSDGSPLAGDKYQGAKRNPNFYFKSLQWTADGTSIITDSSDDKIRTFIVPPDLLEERDEPRVLEPYSSVECVEPVRAVIAYPGFDLQDASTTLFLCSFRDHPIRLHSALSPDLVASYSWMNPTTEAYIAPYSLAFTPDGQRFVAGAKNLIAIFDVSRLANGPVSVIPTTKVSKIDRGNSVTGMSGIVSALSIDPGSGILAAAALSRQVCLLGSDGQGENLGVFGVHGNEADKEIGGRGITQLSWSSCGKYLYIGERKSDGIMVYDIRNTGQLLSWATGRKANTNQRLGFDLFDAPNDFGCELWAGGTDGKIRVWNELQTQGGGRAPDQEFCNHEDSVSGIAVHRSGSVAASCSGQRSSIFDTEDEGSDDVKRDSPVPSSGTLKIWTA